MGLEPSLHPSPIDADVNVYHVRHRCHSQGGIVVPDDLVPLLHRRSKVVVDAVPLVVSVLLIHAGAKRGTLQHPRTQVKPDEALVGDQGVINQSEVGLVKGGGGHKQV